MLEESDPLPLTDPEEIRLWSGRGAPDRAQFRKPAEFYYHRYVELSKEVLRPRGHAWSERYHSDPELRRQFHEMYQEMVNCTWGLLARQAESIPFALKLLSSSSADHRGTAGFFLGSLRGHPEVAPMLVSALQQETETEARDTIIVALGRLRDPSAIPALAAIVRDAASDADTRFTAAQAICQITNRRFRRERLIESVVGWLDGQRL